MSKRKRELTSEERKLWRRVAQGVKARKSLPAEDEEESAAANPAPARGGAALPAPSAAAQAPRRAFGPLADRGEEKRVRRGRVEIGARLDLHGHTQRTAREALVRFLERAHARGERAVIVITGAGRGGEGVLRRMLPLWLGDGDVRTMVSGYAQAHRAHGGAGAYYVFLKRSETPA